MLDCHTYLNMYFYTPPIMHPQLLAESIFTSATKETKIDDKSFYKNGLKLFNHHYKFNSAYKKHCNQLNKKQKNITHWKDIPAVTTDIFKLPTIPVISFHKNQIHRTFTTSGTTHDIKGKHHFPSLEIYEHSITTCWDQLSLPKPHRAIFLIPKPQDAPQSSLSHMMGILDDAYSQESTWMINADGEMDIKKIITEINEADQPIALLGTALAFLYLFENLPTPLTLPPGSWAMETGGYKGTKRHLEKAELYNLFLQYLGLESEDIINEYSMTELSSQFYTRGLDKSHQGPSWTRIRVIDPLTDEDAPDGVPGYLVIYDLANVHSVIAIRTQDIAIATGDNSFILLGRDPSAIPRGCSRAADSSLRSS